MKNLAITMLCRKHSICHFERAVGESRHATKRRAPKGNLHTKQISPLRVPWGRFGRSNSKSFLQSTITMASAILVVAILTLPVQAEVATMGEALTVAKNWVRVIIQKDGQWAGSKTPEVETIQEFKRGDRLLGYFCSVKPKGYIVVSLRMELAPVKAYSTESDLDPNYDEGMTDLLKGRMEAILDSIQQKLGGISIQAEDLRKVFNIDDYRPAWRALGVGTEGGVRLMDAGGGSGLVPMNYTGGKPPLLTSEWHQNKPFNLQCPTSLQQGSNCERDLCDVGCGPLAAAQVMRYWAWPPWYDWANMPDWIGEMQNGGYIDRNLRQLNQAQIDSVARLCHEVGVSSGAMYCMNNICATGTYFHWYEEHPLNLLVSFENDFEYHYASGYIRHVDYDDPVEWFNRIKIELNLNRPSPYKVPGHIVVCDGWQEFSCAGAYIRQYHMGYGSPHVSLNMWYTLDALPGSDTLVEEMYINIYPGNSLGSLIGAPNPISGVYDVPWYPYRYFDQDALAPMFAIFAPGHNLQFLAGVKVTTFFTGAYIRFAGEPSANTRLFSIKGTVSGGSVAGIRIYDGGIRLYSNGSLRFHPAGPPSPDSLTLLAPNGGEVLVAGSNYVIKWQSQGYIDNVVIKYSTDNGSTWALVDPPNLLNTSNYIWLVPEVFSNQCLVRISDASNPCMSDTSERTFRICSQYEIVSGKAYGGGVKSSGGPYVVRGRVGPPGGTDSSSGGPYTISVKFLPGGLCFVEFDDFAGFAETWLESGSGLASDLDNDGNVDFDDLEILAEKWLCNCPAGWQLSK